MASESPDTKITTEAPVRAPSSVPVDDAVLPFEVAELDLRGRLTRLGPALDDILTKHDYPTPVGKLLGEAIVLATLLGSAVVTLYAGVRLARYGARFVLLWSCALMALTGIGFAGVTWFWFSTWA